MVPETVARHRVACFLMAEEGGRGLMTGGWITPVG